MPTRLMYPPRQALILLQELPEVKSFAYSLNLALLDNGANPDWSFYPLVPYIDPDTKYVIYHNWDFDSAESLKGYTRTGKDLSTINPPGIDPAVSGNGTTIAAGHSATAYQISEANIDGGVTEERNGVWRLDIDEQAGGPGRECFRDMVFS